MESRMVTNCIKLASNDSCTILDLGSGMGGLAERLHYSENIEKIILVDIPLNLVTAYYYLKRGLANKSKISIASSYEDAIEGLTSKEIDICLIPTCFFPCLKDNISIDILSNFHSFSEMYIDTVNYYLSNLPKSIEIICQANSNKAVIKRNGEYKEVPCDKFAYPKGLVEVFSAIQIPLKSCGSRYKTKILRKTTS